MLAVTNLVGFGGGRLRFSAGFITGQNNVPGGSTTTHTFTGISVGLPSPGRITVLGIASRTAISGVTIDGNAATEATQSSNISLVTAFFYLANPTGTTADIVVTLGANNSWCELAVFGVFNPLLATPRGVASNTESNDTTGSSVAAAATSAAGYAHMVIGASLAITPPIGSVSLIGTTGVYSNASQASSNDVTTLAGFDFATGSSSATLNYNAANRGAISAVTFR